jgi:dsRNA-specific ribonuclease
MSSVSVCISSIKKLGFFLGWLCKYFILKSGGLRLYRRLRPAFLGMVVGEALIGGIWILIGMITKVGYRILPG